MLPDSSIPPAPLCTEQLFQSELLCDLELVAGESGHGRPIAHPRVQKAALVLAGHMHGVAPSRVQVLGETEVSYLESLSPEVRKNRVNGLFSRGLSAVVVTRGVAPLNEILEAAKSTQTPLFVSPHRSSRTIALIHQALDSLLAPTTSVHGVLVDVHGLGILLTGPSGIGKSECALFLVERGHRLVADDQVDLRRVAAGDPSGRVVGSAPPALRDHLEVRGLGILNVRDLFGATSVRPEQAVELVIELFPFKGEPTVDRLGLDEQTTQLLGVSVSTLRIPVSPGRDMGVILEVAARNQLLKRAGEHSARRFVERLSGGGQS